MAHLNPQCSEADQLFQKYLDRAILDIHALADDVCSCGYCEYDHDGKALGTGHPLADVMMVKWAPSTEELEQGVAFYGNAGDAIRRSVERLAMDPMDLYGTNVIKCATQATACQLEQCTSWLSKEIQIVGPRLLIIMGTKSLAAINALEIADTNDIDSVSGEIQTWNHTCSAIWCPDIDYCLEQPSAKKEFWQAFKVAGEWYAEKPPF